MNTKVLPLENDDLIKLEDSILETPESQTF